MKTADPDEVERIRRVKEAAAHRLMAIPGVTGHGVGFKHRAGNATSQLAIIVSVERKKSVEEIPPEQLIPSEIGGVPTDIEEHDMPNFDQAGIKAFADKERYRPLKGGICIKTTRGKRTDGGGEAETPGTLGCLAALRALGDKIVFLTCHHFAFGDEERTTPTGAEVGQPDLTANYTCCSKSWATVVGRVLDASYDPDVAIIELDKCVEWRPAIQDVGDIAGTLQSDEINSLVGETVQVRGAQTGEPRWGRVIGVHSDVWYFLKDFKGANIKDENGNDKKRFHRDSIVIKSLTSEPFAQKRDSGSIILDSQRKVVGLLFGGVRKKGTGWASRIDVVLKTFKDYGLEILTPASNLQSNSANSPATTFSMAPDTLRESGTFEPNREELELLTGARNRLLQTDRAQRLQLVISRHTQEIRELIRTQKKVAAAWTRLTAHDLLRSAVHAIRAPKTPIVDFVEGQPLPERTATLARMLARYGSRRLAHDAAGLQTIAERLASASYSELIAWFQEAGSETG